MLSLSRLKNKIIARFITRFPILAKRFIESFSPFKESRSLRVKESSEILQQLIMDSWGTLLVGIYRPSSIRVLLK